MLMQQNQEYIKIMYHSDVLLFFLRLRFLVFETLMKNIERWVENIERYVKTLREQESFALIPYFVLFFHTLQQSNLNHCKIVSQR